MSDARDNLNQDALNVVTDELRPDLGGNVRHGDPATFSPKVWRYVLDRLAPRSMLDVGAGEGHAARWFSNAGLVAYAFDGLEANVQRAAYPLVLHDLCDGPFRCRVDLVYCVEVVEHLDEQFLPALMETFASGQYLLMSHALPGQPGHHHVNCRPSSWWVERLASEGWSLLRGDTSNVRKLGAQELTPTFFAQGGLLFARQD